MLDLEHRARLKNTLKTKCKIVRRAADHRSDGRNVKEDAKQVITSQPTIQPIDLNLLPTFEGVKNLADIQARFISSARAIMLGHDLEIKGKKFSITSLELYLKLHKQKDIWWDAATDKDEDANEQFNRGTWYVRRKKAQRRWRIDITVGNASDCIQAGILIRQLDGLGGQQPGPATALHRIVRDEFSDISFEPEQLALLDKIHGKQIDGSDGSPLILRQRSPSLGQCLAKGRRFNLPPNLNESIRDAALRVSVLRKYSGDIPITENEVAESA